MSILNPHTNLSINPYEKTIPSHTVRHEADTIYFNIVIPSLPNETGFTPAYYQQQLSQPIVNNPQDYFLAVVRFTLPGTHIPIMIPQIQPFPNTNLNNTIYSVTLSYNGNFSPEIFVQFISQAPAISPGLPLSASHPRVDKTPYYFVYEYTWFLSLINTALATAFAAIPLGTPIGSSPPFFIFDPVSERISLIAQQAYYDQALPLHIDVITNATLSRFFDGIRSIGLGTSPSPIGRDLLFDIRNLNDSNWYRLPGPAFPAGLATLLQMEQEYPALSDWNVLKSVQIVSNLLPINKEYIQGNVNTLNNGIINAKGILADFVPAIQVGPEARTTIEFFANGPWRLIDLFGPYPVTKVDIGFFWIDADGNSYLVDLGPNDIASIKLVFLKKKLYLRDK